MSEHQSIDEQSKQQSVSEFRQDAGDYLTTNKGVRVSNTDDSLKAGSRGSTLIEDFHPTSKVNYSPNSLGGGSPATALEEQGGFVSHPERVEGHKMRERSLSFKDHFSQATWFSQSSSSSYSTKI